ncbi:MAG TPA: tyrosine--tRNA ligase [Gemmatimonadota bacterium]|nr:tyrosine--tRNA ligase [Gemmatimonadota bacterium]
MTPKRSFPPVDEQLVRIRRNAEDLIPEDELVAKLERSRKTATPLVVKLGFDPTRPDLHLGHTVTLRKLRDFQELGHTVTFVIGSFTAMIGDPSGRSATRPALTREDVDANAATFREQAFKILDPERTVIRYNGEWLSPMTFEDVVRLASRYTVARMIEREDFRQRLESGTPISIHELLYPLAQGYDSVALEADVELGGTDQKFNLLVGRDLQREYGQEPQVILTVPLIEGTDGEKKMSKSYDNAVGLTEPPEEMYGKTMSIPDGLIVKWLRLAVDAPEDEVAAAEAALAAGENPRDAKRRLARRIVETFHGPDAAAAAEAHFERLFVRHEIPEEIEARTVALDSDAAPLAWVLREAGLVASVTEGRRMIGQGAVRWGPDGADPERVEDPALELAAGESGVLQVGKRRFARVTLERK